MKKPAMKTFVVIFMCFIKAVLTEDVVKFDSDTFPAKLEDKPHFIMFFAPW